jgi:hypothetical protein
VSKSIRALRKEKAKNMALANFAAQFNDGMAHEARKRAYKADEAMRLLDAHLGDLQAVRTVTVKVTQTTVRV